MYCSKETIDSIKDEKVLEARSLQTSKGRRLVRKFLLEGEEAISWALNSPCKIQHVFIHEKQNDHRLLAKLNGHRIPFYYTSDGILKKISDTSYLIPFIGVASFPESAAHQPNMVVVLDRVKDLGNIGTLVRTACAFGIRDFIATEEDFDFFYKKTIDASRGLVFHSALCPFHSGKEAIRHLKNQGYQIVATTSQASTLQSFATVSTKPIALVFGNETEGVSQEVLEEADVKIHIPMNGAVESLNVGVAAGISLYEMKVKWVLAMLTKVIHESLGRHLYCTSRWSRQVFNVLLRKATPFDADQAILMMILKCDVSADKHRLASDAAIAREKNIDGIIQPLLQNAFITEKDNQLSLSEKGEEALAKIWPLHEEAERLILAGISEVEQSQFRATLEKMCKNCEQITPYDENSHC